MFVNVLLVLDELVANGLLGIGRPLAQLGYAIDYVLCQMEAIQIVHDTHIKRCRGRALLLIAPHVEILVVGPPVRETVNQPGISMKGKYDRFIFREEGIEVVVAQAVWMFSRWLEVSSGRRR